MKPWIALLAVVLAPPAFAASVEAIPEREPEFVDTVQKLNQQEIAELLGDPAYQTDIRNKMGDVVGAIWHYHAVTTTEDGQYYPTTELDFIGDRVVNVILINSDIDGNTMGPDDDQTPVSLPSLMSPDNTF